MGIYEFFKKFYQILFTIAFFLYVRSLIFMKQYLGLT